MKTIRFKTNFRQFFTKHWFNLGLGCFVAFMLVEKDFSVNFRLTAPKAGSAIENPVPGTKTETSKKQPKKFSFKGLTQGSTQKSGLLEKISPFSAPEPETNPNALLLSPLEALRLVDESYISQFLDRFSNVASNEMKKFNIPASVILGQALLGSAGGSDPLIIESNNFFRLPCQSNWQGKRFDYKGLCIKEYETAWNAFRDHSVVIAHGDFKHLTNLNKLDYKSWAKGLEMSGYNSIPNYAQLLIQVIEEYHLNRFDD